MVRGGGGQSATEPGVTTGVGVKATVNGLMISALCRIMKLRIVVANEVQRG